MVFSGSRYSVLLVSVSDAFEEAVRPLLPPERFGPVTRVGSLREAKHCQADLVIVSAPLPDGDGLAYCLRLCEESDAAVLLLVRQEQLEAVTEKALPAGILTLPKPLSPALFRQSLASLCTMRERLRSRAESRQTVEDTIEELKLVNRAKWLLITCLNMTEEEAHRYIGRLAMQRRHSRREIAESIIRTYSQ